MTRTRVACTVVALMFAGCDLEPDASNRRRARGDDASELKGDAGSCAEGVAHVGFAGHDFVSDRKPGAIGDDRRRVKPYSALRTASTSRSRGGDERTPARRS